MSKVQYESKIGDHNDKVYLSIDIRVSAGLNKEDYAKIRDALETIEDVVWQYKEVRGEEPES